MSPLFPPLTHSSPHLPLTPVRGLLRTVVCGQGLCIYAHKFLADLVPPTQPHLPPEIRQPGSRALCLWIYFVHHFSLFFRSHLWVRSGDTCLSGLLLLILSFSFAKWMRVNM